MLNKNIVEEIDNIKFLKKTNFNTLKDLYNYIISEKFYNYLKEDGDKISYTNIIIVFNDDIIEIKNISDKITRNNITIHKTKDVQFVKIIVNNCKSEWIVTKKLFSLHNDKPYAINFENIMYFFKCILPNLRDKIIKKYNIKHICHVEIKFTWINPSDYSINNTNKFYDINDIEPEFYQ